MTSPFVAIGHLPTKLQTITSECQTDSDRHIQVVNWLNLRATPRNSDNAVDNTFVASAHSDSDKSSVDTDVFGLVPINAGLDDPLAEEAASLRENLPIWKDA